jgi:hypothetical protein
MRIGNAQRFTSQNNDDKWPLLRTPRCFASLSMTIGASLSMTIGTLNYSVVAASVSAG